MSVTRLVIQRLHAFQEITVSDSGSSLPASLHRIYLWQQRQSEIRSPLCECNVTESEAELASTVSLYIGGLSAYSGVLFGLLWKAETDGENRGYLSLRATLHRN